MADLKCVYKAETLEGAETALDALDEKWGVKYPVVIKSWRRKWANLSVCFKYPPDIRRVIYTTSAIEAVHRQFRKLLYLVLQNAAKKWTMPSRTWKQALNQFAILFQGRFPFSIY